MKSLRMAVWMILLVLVFLSIFQLVEKRKERFNQPIANSRYSFVFSQTITNQETYQPNQPVNWIEKIIAPIIGALVAGIVGIITLSIQNRIANNKAKASRKIDFISFLEGISVELDWLETNRQERVDIYKDIRTKIAERARRITDDIPKKHSVKFRSLIESAVRLTPSAVDNPKTGKNDTIKAVSDIIHFLDSLK